MTRLLLLLGLLSVVSGAQAVTVRQWNTAGCSGFNTLPETGGFTSGACQPALYGQGQRVTCVAGVSVKYELFQDSGCTYALYAVNASTTAANTCLTLSPQQSVSITCDEAAITDRSKTSTYSDAGCTAMLPGTTVYADAAVGFCVPPAPNQMCADGACMPVSTAEYCSADRASLFEFEFAGAGVGACSADTWIGGRIAVGAGSAGACKPVANSNPARYTLRECPSAASPPAPLSWPPGAPEERYAMHSYPSVAGCAGGQGVVDHYSRLGYCRSNGAYSLKISCAPNGGFYARSYFNGTSCDPAQLQEVNVRRLGVPAACTSDYQGGSYYLTCPATLTSATTFSLTSTDVAQINWVPGSNCTGGFAGPNWTSATLYTSGACQILESAVYTANATTVTEAEHLYSDSTCAIASTRLHVFASDTCIRTSPSSPNQISYSSTQSPAGVRFGLLSGSGSNSNGGATGSDSPSGPTSDSSSGGAGGGNSQTSSSSSAGGAGGNGTLPSSSSSGAAPGNGTLPGDFTGSAAASHGQAAAVSVLLAIIVAAMAL